MTFDHPNRITESPVSQKSVTPFCVAELQRALTEQTFAIGKNSMISCTQPDDSEARASIVLLEGVKIDVQLTMQGFTVIVDHSNSESGPTYETLDDLLHAVSPLYTQKHQEEIVNALSRLPPS